MVHPAAALVLGYLLGSLPSAVAAGRMVRGIDIRRHGSGNAGAANALRLLGRRPALAVLAIDSAKGWLAAWVGARLAVAGVPVDPTSGSDSWAQFWPALAGAAAVLGHLFPLFAGFRGGKGVATAAGVALFLAPRELGIAVTVFVVAVALTRRVSAGSIAAAAALPVAVLALGHGGGGRPALAFAGAFLGVVLWTHRKNLRRLRDGTEPPVRV